MCGKTLPMSTDSGESVLALCSTNNQRIIVGPAPACRSGGEGTQLKCKHERTAETGKVLAEAEVKEPRFGRRGSALQEGDAVLR
jgi:hypothetical protein